MLPSGPLSDCIALCQCLWGPCGHQRCPAAHPPQHLGDPLPMRGSSRRGLCVPPAAFVLKLEVLLLHLPPLFPRAAKAGGGSCPPARRLPYIERLPRLASHFSAKVKLNDSCQIFLSCLCDCQRSRTPIWLYLLEGLFLSTKHIFICASILHRFQLNWSTGAE